MEDKTYEWVIEHQRQNEQKFIDELKDKYSDFYEKDVVSITIDSLYQLAEKYNLGTNQKEQEKMIINNLEWSKIKKHTKTFGEIKIPKGWRLPTVDELKDVYKTDKAEKFDDEYKNKWHWFFCEQTKWAKENNRTSRVFLYSDGDLYSYDGLAYSGGNGRVVFVRREKKRN